MNIYIFLLILIVIYKILFLSENSFKNKKYFLFLSFFTMALVLGLRGPCVGEDTVHYSVGVFNAFKDISWLTVLSHPLGVQWSVWGESIEYLFAILYKVVQLFSDNGQVFLLVVALITCLLFACFIYINISDYVFFATIVFLCDALFMGSFNGIRQMLALSIAINAYAFMEKTDYKKGIFIIAIAFFVHASSILMLPFLCLHMIRNYKKGTMLIVTLAIAMMLGFSFIETIVSIVIPKYRIYFLENYWTNSVRGTLILWVVLITLCLYVFKFGIKNKKEFFGMAGVILYITVEIIGLKIAVFTRISYFFRAFLMMFFPACGERFSNSSRTIYYLVIFVLLLLEYLSYASVPTRYYLFGSLF